METKTIPFSLRNISTDQFAIIEESYIEDGGKVQIKTDLEFGIIKEDQMLGVFVKINLIQNNKPFLILKSGCHFYIETEAFLACQNKEQNKIVFPQGFISHLALLAVGTARGILHAKTESTPLNRYFLPTVNLSEMIISDLEF